MEAPPYSPEEQHRDAIEQRLAAQANKREINYRQNNGITVIAYWLMKENICLIFVSDERTNSASEFQVPNDQVGMWFDHPFAHPDAKVDRYEQRRLSEGD